MTVTKRNANVALMLMYRYRLVTVFKDYFGELEEESIRDNFVIIYEVRAWGPYRYLRGPIFQ